MALNIKHPDADRLARQLAAKTGETLTDAVLNALRERLSREEARRRGPSLRRELAAIRKRCSSLPALDSRSTDEILGYDEHGVLLLFKGDDFAKTDVRSALDPA